MKNVWHIMITMNREHTNTREFISWCTKWNKKYDIIEGVRVKSIESIKNKLTPSAYLTLLTYREMDSQMENLREVGCLLAHREAWKLFMDNDNVDYCWIFEEGVCKYNDELFQKVEDSCNHFDFITGHDVPVFRFPQKRVNVTLREPSVYNSLVAPIQKIHYGTKCYRVSKQFTKSLLENSEKMDSAVDSYVSAMAIYYNSTFISGSTKKHLVVAKSSNRIKHTFHLQQILYIVIIISLLLNICFICFLTYAKIKPHK